MKRRSLVLVSGKKTELPKGDTLFGALNFSFHLIEADAEVEIEASQLMITTSLEVDGFLEISGCLVML